MANKNLEFTGMKLGNNFKCNGWGMIAYIYIDKKYCGTSIESLPVLVDIIGECKVDGLVNMKTGVITFAQPVDIKPYDPAGKTKSLTTLKVEKYRFIQIKGYVNGD